MLVKIENLNKRYGGAVPLQVLFDINLDIEEKEFVALVGPSGAGKTTLLNIVSTLDIPTSGQITMWDVDVHRFSQKELNRFRNGNLGFIFQDDLLLPHLSAIENVMLPGRIARKPWPQVHDRAKELLGRVGLSDRMEHRPGELSGGQRQRVNIARALINDPLLLLADEPTARLDHATGEGIISLLIELNEELGLTILMVTHEHEIADRTDRIIEFMDGKIVSDQRTDTPVQKPAAVKAS